MCIGCQILQSEYLQADGHAHEGVAKLIIGQSRVSDGFIGRRATKALPTGTGLTANCSYGIYHSTLLNYYSRYVATPGEPPTEEQLKRGSAEHFPEHT